MELIDFFDNGVMQAPESECLVEGNLRLSYRDVQSWTHRIAWALRREGVQAGEPVALLSPNDAWGFLAILGLERAGAVWVPLNARSTQSEWVGQLLRTKTRWLFVHREFAEHAQALVAEGALLGYTLVGDSAAGNPLREWARNTSDEPFPTQAPVGGAQGVFRITTSGGTTGTPKGIVQTQAGVAANVATFFAIARHESPRYLLCNPMTHAAGVIAVPILAMGGTVVFMRRPDPAQVPEMIERERITCLMMAPTSIYALLERNDLDAHDFSSLKYFLFGAAPMPKELLQRALKQFPSVMTQLYAQSEASTLVTAMLPADYEQVLANPALAARLTSVGRPTPFTRLAIMDDKGALLKPNQNGEIVVRTAMVMRGYLDDPVATAATRTHGWHHTGDIGFQDEAGYVFVVDRKRDLIVTGGFNVFPSQIEAFIQQHPSVNECAVIGVKDERWGEAVKAVIELRAGMTLDLEAFARHCRQELGGVKCPKSFEIWPELPRSHLGKILKKDIRKRYE